MKDIEINGKKFTVKEWNKVKVKVFDELLDAQEKGDKTLIKQKQVTCSTGITNEEYENLTVEERNNIYEAIAEVNQVDFQKPKENA